MLIQANKQIAGIDITYQHLQNQFDVKIIKKSKIIQKSKINNKQTFNKAYFQLLYWIKQAISIKSIYNKKPNCLGKMNKSLSQLTPLNLQFPSSGIDFKQLADQYENNKKISKEFKSHNFNHKCKQHHNKNHPYFQEKTNTQIEFQDKLNINGKYCCLRKRQLINQQMEERPKFDKKAKKSKYAIQCSYKLDKCNFIKHYLKTIDNELVQQRKKNEILKRRNLQLSKQNKILNQYFCICEQKFQSIQKIKSVHTSKSNKSIDSLNNQFGGQKTSTHPFQLQYSPKYLNLGQDTTRLRNNSRKEKKYQAQLPSNSKRLYLNQYDLNKKYSDFSKSCSKKHSFENSYSTRQQSAFSYY